MIVSDHALQVARTSAIGCSLSLISVAVSEGKVVLSWPKEPADFSLQNAARLTGAIWENLQAERITNATSVLVTLPAGLSAQFFRLALE